MSNRQDETPEVMPDPLATEPEFVTSVEGPATVPEIPQGSSRGCRIYLLYRVTGHAGDGHDRAGVAPAHSELPAWQYGQWRSDAGRFRDDLRRDAVLLFSSAGFIVRSFRAASGCSALEFRPRAGLHVDGLGSSIELAVCGANHFGPDGIEHSYGHGLHVRCDAAGEACGRLWHVERCLRDWVCAGAGIGRNSRKREPKAAVLGLGRAEPDQWHVWPVRLAGIA